MARKKYFEGCVPSGELNDGMKTSTSTTIDIQTWLKFADSHDNRSAMMQRYEVSVIKLRTVSNRYCTYAGLLPHSIKNHQNDEYCHLGR